MTLNWSLDFYTYLGIYINCYVSFIVVIEKTKHSSTFCFFHRYFFLRRLCFFLLIFQAE
jgi:hypothetical protein